MRRRLLLGKLHPTRLRHLKGQCQGRIMARSIKDGGWIAFAGNGTNGGTMARKKRKPVEPPAEALKPRAFVPRPCSSCNAFRPPATNYSEVVTTRGSIRYCRCRYCGHTWSQAISADQSTTPVVRTEPEHLGYIKHERQDSVHGTRPIVITESD